MLIIRYFIANDFTAEKRASIRLDLYTRVYTSLFISPDGSVKCKSNHKLASIKEISNNKLLCKVKSNIAVR